ncbi:MAG: prepilin-type N-terminal cleavage/methylation domain-containing protein [Gammaproteobacteria bacterium]|nr:prepilin-type N-terminal cleavage/methylation domain-containing protein [Gammaproteobacteria bacterium]
MQKSFFYVDGFHLIEILITLTIVSLLMTTALPAYYHYLTQVRRFEAANDLSKLALALESYFIEHHTYENATLDVLHFPKIIAKNTYQLAILSATENDYRLTATPQAHQAEQDKRCGVLALNAAGEKMITGDGNINECW